MSNLLLLTLLLANPVSDSPEVTVQTIDGPAKGKLMAIGDEIVLETEGKAASFSSQNVNKIMFSVARESAALKTRASIFGGTELLLKELQLQEDQFTFLWSGEASVQVPRSLVSTIQFDPNVPADDWDKVVSNEITADAIVIQRDGQYDLIEGKIKSVSGKNIEFEFRGSVNTVQRSRLAGLRFLQPKRETMEANFAVQDRYGNLMIGEEISFRESDSFASIKLGGKEIQWPLDLIVEVDFDYGRRTFLSGSKPQSVDWHPLLKTKIENSEISQLLDEQLAAQPVISQDESFGSLLAVNDLIPRTSRNPVGRKIFAKGVCLRGGATVVYEIPSDAKKFKAIAGIQATDSDLGDVELVIQIDRKTVFKKRIKTGPEGSKIIDIPLEGDRLSFTVHYGAGGSVGDLLNLCDARFEK